MLLAGQALPDNALYVFMPFAYLQHAGLQAIPDLFIGPPIEEAIDTGWIGWVWAGTALVAIGCGVCPPTRVVGGVLVAALIVTICAASVFLWTPAYYRSAHGLLFTTPWAIIGLCRTRDLWCCGSHRIRILVLTVVLGLFLYALAILVLRGSSPHGGLQWGARFALTFYAPLAILALWRWNCTPPRRILHTAMLVLCILGLGFQLRGLGIIAIDKHYNGTLNAAIATTAPHYVVSDLPWLPLNAAPIYAQKTWFVTSTPAEFEDWLTRAAALPVSEFSIVTNRDTQLFARAGQLAAQHEFHITTVETMVGATVVFHVEQAAPAGRLIE
jgi:multisubunit Na+/H+ antiporter MnhB subunit